MTAVLYRSAGPVTLVGGGPVAAEDLAAAVALAPAIVAADGGAQAVMAAGLTLQAVIGDLDSIADPEGLRTAGIPVHQLVEQDSTDLEKCLYSLEAPLVIGIGFLGGRLDHHLAAMSALLRYAERPVVLLGGDELCLAVRTFALPEVPAGVRISIFPLAPITGLRSEGLRWSVRGLTMAPGGRIGTSNEALGGPVAVAFDRPGALLILPADALPAVVAAVSGQAPAAGS